MQSQNNAIDSSMFLDFVGKKVIEVFNNSPYLQFNQMQMRFEEGEIRGYFDTREELIGNVNFNILHGGVAATMLDSIGGVVAMFEILRRNQGDMNEQMKKISRLATVDLRIDYISPGLGKQFIATAEVIRMGRKGCTTRMQMVNDEGKLIAVGMASFAF
ncbi:thioesterase family protein [Psychrobacter sp. I-STPA10]|uniref:thioesterase family protein n=1 Tax=Psychrobacter sp. I-STPA10 TaxID=2585769 RepID=UPI001E3D275A|nr:thioesterase family protein [Psychrobacter sp. I-STPA10]